MALLSYWAYMQPFYSVVSGAIPRLPGSLSTDESYIESIGC